MSWIPRAFRLLPGPMPVRIAQAAIVVMLALLGLHFFYTWLGNAMLDQGGTIG